MPLTEHIVFHSSQWFNLDGDLNPWPVILAVDTLPTHPSDLARRVSFRNTRGWFILVGGVISNGSISVLSHFEMAPVQPFVFSPSCIWISNGMKPEMKAFNVAPVSFDAEEKARTIKPIKHDMCAKSALTSHALLNVDCWMADNWMSWGSAYQVDRSVVGFEPPGVALAESNYLAWHSALGCKEQ